MFQNKNIKHIPLGELQLDLKSPRLPIHSFNKNDIIEWMLQESSIITLMLSIGENGFCIGESLLVIEENNQYIVVEGNRRLTALKILDNPKLATLHKRQIKQVLDETTYRPKDIPCILFEKREEIFQYLGYKHITGIKTWDMLAKAQYFNNLIPYLESKTFLKQIRELAKMVGTKSNYIKMSLISYKLYEMVNLDKSTFYFKYIADALKYETVIQFLNINLDSENPLENLDEKNLEIITQMFFDKSGSFFINKDDLIELDKFFLDSDDSKILKEGNIILLKYSNRFLLENGIQDIIKESFSSDISKVFIMSNDTKTSPIFRQNYSKNIKSFLFKFPKYSENFIEYIFQSFISEYGIKNIILDLKELRDKIEGFNVFLQNYSDDEEIIHIINKIIEIDNIYDVKRLIYNVVDNSFLHRYNIFKRVENENIIKIFSIIIKLLTYHKNKLFIFQIDNFEDINTVNKNVSRKIVSDIKVLQEHIPQKILFFLSFTSSNIFDVDDLYNFYFKGI